MSTELVGRRLLLATEDCFGLMHPPRGSGFRNYLVLRRSGESYFVLCESDELATCRLVAGVATASVVRAWPDARIGDDAQDVYSVSSSAGVFVIAQWSDSDGATRYSLTKQPAGTVLLECENRAAMQKVTDALARCFTSGVSCSSDGRVDS